MPRKHIHEEVFDASPEELFRLLHTPSAIRAWWGAARAIVHPVQGGTWAAAWGESEDDPEYITVARMTVFDPPRRIVFSDYRYHARLGALPFEADFVTEFTVTPRASGASLRVVQDGFPDAAEADAFYADCGIGWSNTFAGIRRYVESLSSTG